MVFINKIEKNSEHVDLISQRKILILSIFGKNRRSWCLN